MMPYKSLRELNTLNSRGRRLLLNPREPVAAASDNRASVLMQQSTDSVFAYLRAFLSATPTSTSNPTLTYNEGARTLTIDNTDLSLDLLWHDATTDITSPTRITLQQGVHTFLEIDKILWVKYTPGVVTTISTAPATIAVGVNADHFVQAETLLELQLKFNARSNPLSPDYVSAQSAFGYIPLFQRQNGALSLLGGRWFLQSGSPFYFLRQDGTYVPVSDDSIQCTATSGPMVLEGQSNCEITFGSEAQIAFGQQSVMDLGTESQLNLDSDAILSFGGNGRLLVAPPFVLGANYDPFNATYEKSLKYTTDDVTLGAHGATKSARLEGTGGADLEITTDTAGSELTVDVYTGTFSFQESSTIVTDANGATLDISTIGDTSDLNLLTYGSTSPITIETSLAAGDASPILLRSGVGIGLGRVSDADAFPSYALTVSDATGVDAPLGTTMGLHDVEKSDADGSRKSRIVHSGVRGDSSFSALVTLTASHYGAATDNQTLYSIAVSDATGLKSCIRIESGDRILLARPNVTVDGNASLTTDPTEAAHTNSSGTPAFGDIPVFLTRKKQTSASVPVCIEVENADDAGTSINDNRRATAFGWRAQHGGTPYYQARMGFRNLGGGADRATYGDFEIWDVANSVLKKLMSFTREKVTIESNVLLEVINSISGNGNAVSFTDGLRTDIMRAGASLAVSLRGGNLNLQRSDVSLDYFYGAFAFNTPFGVAQIDIDSNAAAANHSVAFASAGNFTRNVDSVSRNSDTQTTVVFNYDCDVALVTNVQPSRCYVRFDLLHTSGTTGNYGMKIIQQGQLNAGVDNRYFVVFEVFDYATGTSVDLTAADGETYRILVHGYNPSWT